MAHQSTSKKVNYDKAEGDSGGSADFSKYKPEDFIIPSKDTKGESIRVWNRIQPGHDRQVAIIVGSKKFPFRTPGDVMRFCLHDGIKRLLKMEKGIKSVMQQVDAINVIVQDEEANLDFQNTLHMVGTVVQRHLGSNADTEARRVVKAVMAQIDDMPHGFWRSRYTKQMQESYGHLLKGTKGRATMRPSAAQHDDEDEDANDE